MLSERNAQLDKHDNPRIEDGSGMLTGAQLSALADFLVASRSTYSEPWDRPGTIAALRAIDINAPWYRIGYAAIKAAADPQNLTPGVLHGDGAHWTRSISCPEHPTSGMRADGECAGHWLDRQPEPEPFRRAPMRIPATAKTLITTALGPTRRPQVTRARRQVPPEVHAELAALRARTPVVPNDPSTDAVEAKP